MLCVFKDLFYVRAHVCVLSAGMYVHHIYAVPTEGGQGVRYSVTGVTGCSEPSCGCWDLNLGPLQEQSVILTSEPSLLPQDPVLKCNKKVDC